jgi:replicative DNA helicase
MVSAPLSNRDSNEEKGRLSNSRGRPRDEANFDAMPDGVPPQNLEAEEAVLGGILLDPDAISRVADVLQPEAFYLTAHREL